MPPVNPTVVSAGVIALSVAVAAAIAVYESPEVRRMADDLRRRIAVALQSLGENIAPNNAEDETNGEPIFNRPEDADGFLMSRAANGQDVVADEESRRRQRDELLYWNRLHLEKQKKLEEEQRAALADVEKATQEAAAAVGLPASALALAATRNTNTPTTFDQLLEQDKGADHGTYVVNTGADFTASEGLVRRRRADGVRGLQSFAYSNPFADEYGIEMEEQEQHDLDHNAYLSPDPDEVMSDIYNATEPDTTKTAAKAVDTNGNSMDAVVSRDMAASVVPSSIAASELFFDASDPTNTAAEGVPSSSPATLGHDASSAEMLDHLLSASQSATTISHEQQQQHEEDDDLNDSRRDAFSSIQAWAQNSSSASNTGLGFYSPLPVTPSAPLSEPDVISAGDLTPTDSMSVVDADVNGTGAAAIVGASSEHPVNRSGTSTPSLVQDTASQAGSYDVMSDDEEGGMMTPTSWTEVGSVVSESDAGVPPMAA